MKVILRADVEKLGYLGDVVNVRAGYGRNYLLPKGLAMPATPGNMKVFETERKKLEAHMTELRQQAAGLGERIQSAEVIIPMRVGENNKLYGSVTAHSIGEALDALGLSVDRRRILLDSSIRSLGTHTVRVRLHADVVIELPVTVVAEKTFDNEDDPVEDAAQTPTDETQPE
jgi:large subunit ribosomal protein L9